MIETKKMSSTIISVTTVIILAIISYSCLGNVKQKPLPEKYSDYQYIRDIKETEKYTVIRYETSGGDAPAFFCNDSSVIIETYEKIKDEEGNDEDIAVYYKLDENGNIRDAFSLYEFYRYNICAGYFIGENNYISWCVDGDKSEKMYRNLNNELKINEREAEQTLVEWYKKSEIVTQTSFIHRENLELYLKNHIDRWHFLYDGQWFSLDCLFDYDKNFKKFIGKGHELDRQEISTHFDEGDYSQLRNENFYLEYFHREQYYKRRNASPFSPTGGFGSPPHWGGIGFFNIMLNGDTLHVKMDMSEIRDDMRSYTFAGETPLIIYRHKDLNFIAITQNIMTTIMYLIKPKEK